MSSNPRLSVILITKNEEKNVTRCLESVKWADEIIVLDSGSTDQTIAICQQYTPHVFQTDWPGFGKQKNRALAKATGEWVLSLDADEFLSSPLIQKIQDIIKSPLAADAYKIKRITQFCGKYLYYGDWQSDFPIRLFKREKAIFKDVSVHESLLVEGTVAKITEVMWHHSFLSLEAILQKMNIYSTLSAENLYHQGRKSSITKAVLKGLWTFVRGYFLRLGFLDGKYGFLLALINAEGCFYKYLKLWQLHRNTSSS